MSEAHPVRLDFYFSQQQQDAKKGRLKRVHYRTGCRMVPEHRGYATLPDGRVVEFSMMQPPGRDVTQLPAFQRYTDFVFLGTGTFSHWGEELTAPPDRGPGQAPCRGTGQAAGDAGEGEG